MHRHHLIDPLTGEPADNDLEEVTVAAASCRAAEVAATACFVLGSRLGPDLLTRYGFAGRLTYRDGARRTVGIWPSPVPGCSMTTWSAVTWDTARAGGFAAYILLSAAVAVGLVLRNRWQTPKWPRLLTNELHGYLSLLALVFIAVHVLAVLVDPFTRFGLAEVFVPFASHYRPLWMGLGVVSLYLLLAVWVSSRLRTRIGFTAWCLLHVLAYGVYVAATVHGLGTGRTRDRSGHRSCMRRAHSSWERWPDGGCSFRPHEGNGGVRWSRPPEEAFSCSRQRGRSEDRSRLTGEREQEASKAIARPELTSTHEPVPSTARTRFGAVATPFELGSRP